MTNKQQSIYKDDQKAKTILESLIIADIMAHCYFSLTDVDPELTDNILEVARNLKESLETLTNAINEIEKI